MKKKNINKNIFKNLFKVIVFAVIFATLLSNVTTTLSWSSDRMSYNSVKGFYEEPRNTLDAVYVGSSNVLAFWNPLFAWEEYGIRVSAVGTNSQPFATAEFMVREAHKRQPNALIMVNINTMDETTSVPRLHKVFSFAPFSFNKINSINDACRRYGFDKQEDRLELYFPIIRFHTNWTELKPIDFSHESNGFKGTIVYGKYFNDSVDVSSKFVTNDQLTPLSDLYLDSVTSLLDYCDKAKPNIIFVTVPQAKDAETLGKYNTINKIVQDRGYPVLNLMDKNQEMGISTKKDYYNDDHINIHGSLKFTYYVSEYLIENYGFKDTRGDEAYKSWDDGLKEYMELADSSIMDFQMDANYDSTTLSEPANTRVTAGEDAIVLTWDPVIGAQGYTIYERYGTSGAWINLGDTNSLAFTDTTFVSQGQYNYRIVPYKLVEGKKTYGDFSYRGLFVTAR